MVGRAAYQNPWMLREVDECLYGETESEVTRLEVVKAMTAYLEAGFADDANAIRACARHMIGLTLGLPGARRWRQCLSDPKALEAHGPGLLLYAWREAFGD